eukprot:514103-Rhodomonas_salina.1
MSVIARHATPRDLPEIEALCEVESHILEKHWGPFTLGRLMERSALSCCAVDDRGSVVGFACFHHFPVSADICCTYLSARSAMSGSDAEHGDSS